MKIDFHTNYSKKDFLPLFKEAIKLGLDGLVVAGLPENEEVDYRSLKIFPAHEVEWKAAIEVKRKRSEMDKNPIKRIYHGKALTIFQDPKTFIKSSYPIPLFDLLEIVSRLRGVTIALHDETTFPITGEFNDYHTYPFDGIRIRPFSQYDIHFELPLTGESFNRAAVTGSNAKSPRELYNNSFTVYDFNIPSQHDLVQAVKQVLPNRLYVRGEKRFFRSPVEFPILDSVKPLERMIKD